MYYIESERLKLIPLNYEHLLLYKNNRPALEKALGLNPSTMVIDAFYKAETKDALQNFWLPNTKLYPELYYWYTSWEIVLKQTNTSIGGIGFGGYPDDYGETSIGYVVDQQHWGFGYATEALNTISKWGFAFTLLKALKADTQSHNLLSQRVLIKAGFKHTDSKNGLLYYRLPKGNTLAS
ncbi:GNAT family N-acetyltransferase [Mucilaginibacter sp. PAMB04168]|uniref:GNAT family N-acetyltransferase n=1 Tax=Mucilaginibacter sp. PAMB04168 TaxID=3138567 RepID=UPI0031F706A8